MKRLWAMLKGWKTIIWNIANGLVYGMTAYDAAYAIPDSWEKWWLPVFLAGNIILRMVTTGPMGSKG